MPAVLALACIDDIAPTRWRNGGGWTRELCAWPAPDDWVVRVSVADIDADGPFSTFAGVDRWFAVLEGAGVELVHGASAPIHLTTADGLHRFAGEDATEGRLLGAITRDFNVMVRRDRADADVGPIASKTGTRADWTGCFATAPFRARPSGDKRFQRVPARALAWTASPNGLDVEIAGPTRGWRIEVRVRAAG